MINAAVPAVNPLAEVICTPVKVAVPLETVALPRLVVPAAKVTVPVMIPLFVEDTAAVRVVVAPMATELGAAVTVVDVADSFNAVASAVYSAPPSMEPRPVARS